LFLDGEQLTPITGLDEICNNLRRELASDPPSHELDEHALDLLSRALTIADRFEYGELLPRRAHRALRQMREVLTTWEAAARIAGEDVQANYYQQLTALTKPVEGATQDALPAVDPYVLAERWYHVITPILREHQRMHPKEPFVLLNDVTPRLKREPLPIETLDEAFSELPKLTPLAERVAACILGIPAADIN
jgi:hypothetical protein